MSTKISEIADAGVTVYPRKIYRYGLARRAWQKMKRQIFTEVDKDAQWVLAQGPDLVIISQGGNADGTDWMEFCNQKGLPYVAIIQCNAEFAWPNDEIGARLFKAYQLARHVFCVSKANLRLLERQVGGRLENASVVWNPYNAPAQKLVDWPTEDGVWRLACVARLEPAAKGQDLLFEVLTASEWRKRRVEINLYGGGPWHKNLQRLAEVCELKNVHFRGHVDDIGEVWKNNHLLVLPSRYEGLPLALVESMWYSRPAVVTDVGGNAEICLDGTTGFVAEAPTVRLLAQTMERAWNARQEWRKMGQNAHARVQELVPADPVQFFSKQLISCCRKQD
jgi:glycosyltransferase involved in cell wall biosynthesis